ncbi:MAG: hypothetical protein ABL888_23355 [Pirellulaceae bacterium]
MGIDLRRRFSAREIGAEAKQVVGGLFVLTLVLSGCGGDPSAKQEPDENTTGIEAEQARQSARAAETLSDRVADLSATARIYRALRRRIPSRDLQRIKISTRHGTTSLTGSASSDGERRGLKKQQPNWSEAHT